LRGEEEEEKNEEKKKKSPKCFEIFYIFFLEIKI
jgi:hypothetical protein